MSDGLNTNAAEVIPAPVRQRNRRLGLMLAGVAIFMAAFTTVLWYTAGILCDWAGIGINPNAQPRSEVRMIATPESREHEQ